MLGRVSKELAEAAIRPQDIRLKCLEIAAQMLGPRPLATNETFELYLNRFLPLSYAIEKHVTGMEPKQKLGY